MRSSFIFMIVLCFRLFDGPPAAAQSVPASKAAPAPGVRVNFDRLRESGRPRVAIYRADAASDADSPRSEGRLRLRESRIRDAVSAWELLLLGLDVPYAVIDEEALGDGPGRGIDVLIMPAARPPDERQLRSIREFVRAGGGLIASGSFAEATGDGGDAPTDASSSAAAFRELFGAVPVSPPEGAEGFILRISGTSPLASGVDAGFGLNFAVRRPAILARTFSATGAGRLASYAPDSDPGTGSDALTAALVARCGRGRTVWTAFDPQDVSAADDQQVAWRRMAIAALADVSGSPIVSVAAWPSGRAAALGIAVLPSLGYEPVDYLHNLEHLLTWLDRERLSAEFFLPGRETAPFGAVTASMKRAGTLAATTRREDALLGQSPDVQEARIAEGLDDLGLTGAAGFYPPGLLFDGATLRALAEADVDYLLRPGGPSLLPAPVDFRDFIDFREDAPDRPIIAVPVVESAETDPLEAYKEVRESAGLFVLPYRVERIRAGSAAFHRVERVVEQARRDETWIASLSEIVRWRNARGQIRIGMDSVGEDRVRIEVVNAGPTSTDGVTLRLRSGAVEDVAGGSVTVDDPRIRIIRESAESAASGGIRLQLPELPAGAALEFVVSVR
jgi:hypothetical protein